MKLAIITGASKGLGASIAKRMLKENIGVISISRTENVEIKNQAKKNQLFYEFQACDLSNLEAVKTTIHMISETITNKKPEIVYIFNNAGIVEPIQTVGSLHPPVMIDSIHINLLTPMLICNHFIGLGNKLDIPFVIVNVTSGAAERTQHGWSVYSTTKAGINMFTKTTSLELTKANSKHLIIGYSPGIMDTQMQAIIRNSTKEAFDDIEKFRDFKVKGLLRETDMVANALIDLLFNGKAVNGEIYHVNNLL